MKKSMHHARSLALQYLYRWEMNPTTPEQLAKEVMETEPDLPSAQYYFVVLLLNGVIEKQPELDEAITPYLKKWTLDRLSKVDLSILRLATYELLYQKETPALVVLDEAIKLSNEFSAYDGYKFINGVLQGFIEGNHIHVTKKEK